MATSFREPSLHSMKWYAVPLSPMNSISRIGMMSAKENNVKMAARMLNKILRIKYFLYGGTKRLNIWMKSFISKFNLKALQIYAQIPVLSISGLKIKNVCLLLES